MLRIYSVCCCVFAFFLSFSAAQNITSAAQSPQRKIGWQAGPNQRGTLTLVWSCLATVVTCTWSILHLNVPHRDDSPWTKRLRKVKWMCITVLFPEFVFAKAICELKDAVDDTFEMKRSEEKLDWKVEFGKSSRALSRLFHLFKRKTRSSKNSCLSQLSGDIENQEDMQVATKEVVHQVPPATVPGINYLRVDAQTEPKADGVAEEGLSKVETQHNGHQTDNQITLQSRLGKQKTVWTPVHSYFANMGGFDEDNQHTWSDTTTLTAETIRLRCQQSRSATISIPDRTEIEDKGKADVLVKLLAVSQITWLVLSVIVRGSTHLPVSQLEIITVAFSAIAVATYLCNLWKPKDVDVPIKLSFPKEALEAHPGPFWPSSNYIGRPEKETKWDSASFFDYFLRPSGERRETTTYQDRNARVFNDTCRIQRAKIPMISRVIAASTFIFGGLHCIAWSFDFPSKRRFSYGALQAFCLPLYHLRTFQQTMMNQTVIPRLQILEQYPTEYWDVFEPYISLLIQFKDRAHPDRVPLSRLKTPTISFEELLKPPEESEGECITLIDSDVYHRKFNMRAIDLRYFYKCWESFKIGDISFIDLLDSISTLVHTGNLMLQSLETQYPGPYGRQYSWILYEAVVGSDFKAKGKDLPHFYLEQYLATELSNVVEQWSQIHQGMARSDMVSGVLSLAAGIVYGIARMALLVVAFTSLRKVPEELYTNSWTRFMPNIS
ncbi:hypothetical protein N431DRAFT_463116 [Stipitochalara longipes BDJ]|nr:hypothetical protein N431DRAFT_463116 [Stipitochalara longipes BDJ]